MGRKDRLFFTGMGFFVALVTFAGFARSYYLSHWLAPPERTPELTPLLHVHATVFTLWILLGVAQPALIAAGRRQAHRVLGIGGAVLALFVWGLGNLASVEAMEVGYKGLGDPYAFYAITFFSMQAFGIVVALGIAWRKHAERHKRLMLLSSAAILEAAVGRLPLEMVASTAPSPSISARTSSSSQASSTIGRRAAGSTPSGSGAEVHWWRARCCASRS
jgi:hypothetical protein